MANARKQTRTLARGFTLIELMVAILVSSIVLMGVFAFATIQKDTANLQRRQITLQQSLEGSMHSMGADIRMAGLGFGRQCSEVRVSSVDEGRLINPEFFTRRAAYMQLEPDYDEPLTRGAGTPLSSFC